MSENKQTKVLKSFVDIKEAIGKSVNDYVVEFGHEFGMGIDAIRRAGKIYADAIIRHPSTAMQKFQETYPAISPQTWETLERIGNGDLNPNAMLLSSSVASKVARIPIKNQDKMFAENTKGFMVVNPSTLKPRLVPIASLSTSQANLLIDEERGRVRTVDEQLQIIKDKAKEDRDERGKPRVKYLILGNTVRIGNIEIGKETLRKILREMDGLNPA